MSSRERKYDKSLGMWFLSWGALIGAGLTAISWWVAAAGIAGMFVRTVWEIVAEVLRERDGHA